MRKVWGYLSIITATVFFGMSATLDKIMLSEMHPITIGAYTYLIAGIFLFMVRQSPLKENILDVLNRTGGIESRITGRDYLLLLLTALLSTVIAPVLFLTGLGETTAVNASLLLNIEVLFIIILGYLIFRETLKFKDLLGIMLLIGGAAYLVSEGEFQSLFNNVALSGNLLVILAAFFWSLDTVLSKFLSKKRDLILLSGIKSSVGGFLLLIIMLILGLSTALPTEMLPYALMVSIFSIGCSFILIYIAVREIGAAMVGSLFPLSSLFGAIFAFLILNEPFSAMQVVSGIVMLTGVIILYWNGMKK
ncbi:DMT family transporter [Methanothermobacter marburgensis]|uniref:Predicted transporter protein n=1 Tax=Methanothermobacter marburgensis (strain ATCC BAA-927 / DSM 2133 / JCM 14651 / NBRC 100331 / OCM 82 / Marburg) TaxID=79929 RepID=D9PX78_METTM|nr:DMT family transporter [Methanothermobacter marburgensis]ADL58826.1 predicted transporter protein [Methanothermobacter marburgensis str. Marburg]WBF09378.1 DMT family transporter [Methanothermobacter marburgensis]